MIWAYYNQNQVQPLINELIVTLNILYGEATRVSNESNDPIRDCYLVYLGRYPTMLTRQFLHFGEFLV